jgi:hypothetical protein
MWRINDLVNPDNYPLVKSDGNEGMRWELLYLHNVDEKPSTAIVT